MWKVGKSEKEWEKVAKSGEKWRKVVKNGEKWRKVGKKVNGQGHRDGILLFESTVISQKLSHRKISIFFHRHLFGYSIR